MKIPFLENTQKTETKETNRSSPKKDFRRPKPSHKPLKNPSKKPSVFDIAAKHEASPFFEAGVSLHHANVQDSAAPIGSLEASFLPPTSGLNPEITRLVEEMTKFIRIESQKGITTTTVTVKMEGSVFNESQIILKHYDTAPHSFNIQFSGSPEGKELFAIHLENLRASLQTHETLEGFDIHILPPVLHEKSDLYPRRKEKKGQMEKKEKATRVDSKKKISF